MVDNSVSLGAQEIYEKHSDVIMSWVSCDDPLKRALAKTLLEVLGL